MITAIIIFAITYILIASERFDKTAISILGASTVIGFGVIPHEIAMGKVDLNVIFLLVGMMIVVNILAETGFFEWVAVTIAQHSRGNGPMILVEMVAATALLSAFLDNVTTVILVAPITILVTQVMDIPTIPFLILEAIFSNIGGTATLIGDPPNILIGSKGNLTFNEFILNLTPVVLIIAIVVLALTVLFFGRSMRVSDAARERILRAKPRLAITEPRKLKRALPVLGVIIIGFFLSHSMGIEPGVIAITGAFLMILVCGADLHHAMERVEWSTIFFFIGLFILVGSLEYKGVFEWAGEAIIDWTHGNLLLTVLTILWASAILSAIVDNIPLVIAMLPLIQTMIPAFGEQMGLGGAELRSSVSEPLYWALALGACLGGNGTLIGASANVVITQIARKNKYPITFMQFTAYGFPIMLVTLLICTAYMYLRYF